MVKGKKKIAKGKKADAKAGEHPPEWYGDEHRIEEEGIETGEDAYMILRGILERQDGQNGPDDGAELFMFCEAFKALDEHMRTASGSGPKKWRNE